MFMSMYTNPVDDIFQSAVILQYIARSIHLMPALPHGHKHRIKRGRRRSDLLPYFTHFTLVVLATVCTE